MGLPGRHVGELEPRAHLIFSPLLEAGGVDPLEGAVVVVPDIRHLEGVPRSVGAPRDDFQLALAPVATISPVLRRAQLEALVHEELLGALGFGDGGHHSEWHGVRGGRGDVATVVELDGRVVDNYVLAATSGDPEEDRVGLGDSVLHDEGPLNESVSHHVPGTDGHGHIGHIPDVNRIGILPVFLSLKPHGRAHVVFVEAVGVARHGSAVGILEADLGCDAVLVPLHELGAARVDVEAYPVVPV
mmetsp:Transcript_23583/g.69820  ORF Transcript_23583/g.69820 Transcript_23583/m.69820 type:complete len:244 (-) Transcript_23583:2194-2925(-)